MKKLKRLLRLRNKAGFTLVEVIISCALLGILIVGVMGFITPVLNSVREKEKNARATLLSEAVNNYIASTTQYAYYVTTISGAASGDTVGSSSKAASAKYSGTEYPKKVNKGLETLKTCLGNMKADTFEVRCIGVRWSEDKITKEKKLMLYNEVVDQTTLALNPSKSRPVFEECFYSGLYPVVEFENYDNQYYKVISGVKTPQVEAKDVDVAPGLKLVTKVYTDLDCYNTKNTAAEPIRKNAIYTIEGVSYVGFNNIKSNLINKGDYEVLPNIQLNSYDEALAKDGAKVYSKDGNSYYYPETFIYYIVRKTKT